MSKVWLITGASRGLGRAFTEEALKAGHSVVTRLRFHGHFTGRFGQIQGQGQTISFIATNSAFAIENVAQRSVPAVVSQMSHTMDRTIEKLQSSIPSPPPQPSR